MRTNSQAVVKTLRWSRGTVALFVGMLVVAGPVSAHTDPPGAFSPGLSVQITAFLADGATPALGQDLTECESVFFQATIAWNGAPNASFEGGVLTITTPDGVVHDVTPVGGIPCLGDPGGSADDPALPGGRGVCAGSPSALVSVLVAYTVRPVDIGAGASPPGFITAATQLTGAFSHIGPNDQGGIQASSLMALPVALCTDDNFCTSTVCDPNYIFGPFDGRLGGCVLIDESDVVCPDTEFCAGIVCDEGIDACVSIDESDAVCPDTEFCTDAVCDEVIDACVPIDESDTVCPDTEFCTDTVCDEVIDACVLIDESDAVCPDTEFCAGIVCDEAIDACVSIDESDAVCPESPLCIGASCNEALDSCECETADTDLDGVTDDVDNCPLAQNPSQQDIDLDGFGDVCDNCVLDSNPSQQDTDLDNEGDRCDLDDGILLFTDTGASFMQWQQETVCDSFNLYRGDGSLLPQYTQDPGLPTTAQFCGGQTSFQQDEFLPASGEASIYLVTCMQAGVEGPLGPNGQGANRLSDFPCPILSEELSNDAWIPGAGANFISGLTTDEAAAVRLTPVATCPCPLTEVSFLFGGDFFSQDPQLLTVNIYEDAAGATPGALIWSSPAYLVPPDDNALFAIDLSGEGITVNGAFRVAVVLSSDHVSSLAVDVDGTIASNDNFVFFASAWHFSSGFGISGDWIIRAVITDPGP